MSIAAQLHLADVPNPWISCDTLTVPGDAQNPPREFISLKVGDLTIYPSPDQLEKLRRAIEVWQIEQHEQREHPAGCMCGSPRCESEREAILAERMDLSAVYPEGHVLAGYPVVAGLVGPVEEVSF